MNDSFLDKDNFSSGTEMGFFKKDVEIMSMELTTAIETSWLRVECNLKSEINKLIIWIMGIIVTASIVFFALSKYVH